MRFVYEYRSSDNVRRSGIIAAKDRDAAFRELKAGGIRPSAVKEAPGLVNKLFGKGKRWMAIAGLSLAVLAALVVLMRKNDALEQMTDNLHAPTPRHQIYGDPALMAEIERTDYASVFTNYADRCMARFAQPGTVVVIAASDWRERLAEAVEAGDWPEIVITDDDPREVQELKRIVLWMRKEVRNYLSYEKGTGATYVRRLEERQLRELQIYESTKIFLEKETRPEEWVRRNEALRKIGLRTISPSADQD